MADNGFHIVARGVGVHDQAVVDVKHVLAQDGGAGAEREVVKRGGHRALKRVFRGNNAVLGSAAVHAIEHLGKRRALDKLGVLDAKPMRERARRFVMIRAGWAQIGERGSGSVTHANGLLYAKMLIIVAKI